MTHEERARKLLEDVYMYGGLMMLGQPNIEVAVSKIAAALAEVERETLERAADAVEALGPRYEATVSVVGVASDALRALTAEPPKKEKK